MNSADKLWELKKLEHKRRELKVMIAGGEKHKLDELLKINSKIYNLLED